MLEKKTERGKGKDRYLGRDIVSALMKVLQGGRARGEGRREDCRRGTLQ